MFDFRAIVRVLAAHEAPFAIVGGVAAVMHGAPIFTKDLDILYSLEDGNPARLLSAVNELDAMFYGDDRRLRPELSHMVSRGHKLLSTRFGRVDCLATIEETTTLEDVADHLDWMELDGTPVRVLSLPRLIEVKRRLLRPKDQLALLQLLATLEQREKGS